MRQFAPLFGCSPAAVCRMVKRLRPLLAIERAFRPADAVERLWIVVGTLIPVRGRKTGASSRTYRFSSTPVWWSRTANGRAEPAAWRGGGGGGCRTP